MIVIQSLLIIGGQGLEGLLSYCEWVTVPVFINYDCNLKSATYWRPCGLLNYLMVCSAVNEWRLLCPSFINYDCDPKSASCWVWVFHLFDGVICCEWGKASVCINYNYNLTLLLTGGGYLITSTIWSVNEWRLLCLSTMILTECLLLTGGLVSFSTYVVICCEWVEAPASHQLWL